MTNEDVRKLRDIAQRAGLVNVLEILNEDISRIDKDAGEQCERTIDALERVKNRLLGVR